MTEDNKRDLKPADPKESETMDGEGADKTPDSEQQPISLPPGMELQDLMRRAFADEDSEPKIDVLSGVQDKLSQRSGGKFYSDGWSRTRHPPFSTFFITSLMMLAVVAIIYAILVPLVGEPVELPKEPAPVQLLPPAK